MFGVELKAPLPVLLQLKIADPTLPLVEVATAESTPASVTATGPWQVTLAIVQDKVRGAHPGARHAVQPVEEHAVNSGALQAGGTPVQGDESIDCRIN